MGKSILTGSEIRAAVGVDNLKTLRHEYKVLDLVNEVDGDKNDYYIQNYSALPFIMSIRNQFESRMKISPKQMEGLNKVYKKYKKRKESKK